MEGGVYVCARLLSAFVASFCVRYLLISAIEEGDLCLLIGLRSSSSVRKHRTRKKSCSKLLPASTLVSVINNHWLDFCTCNSWCEKSLILNSVNADYCDISDMTVFCGSYGSL